MIASPTVHPRAARGASALWGAIARSERGRERLLGRRALPATFPRSCAHGSTWWIERAHGVALYCPTPSTLPDGSVVVLSGTLYREGASASWPRAAAQAQRWLLDELGRRDTSALGALRGEFALVFWDAQRQRLLLARDALGQRNIYLRSTPDLHFFCSELEPLLRDPSFTCQLDVESAYHYLACGLPPPGHTLARGVRCIPAAHALRWEPGRPLLCERYWTPLHDASGAEATQEAISGALDASISARLQRTGSQALLLSGGLDSSYLAAAAAAEVGPSQLAAYTIEFAPQYRKNETGYARLVAEACKIRHRVLELHARDALALLGSTLEAAEPCSAWTCMTHRWLLRAIREDGHEHLLSGLGADEVFGGYKRLLEFHGRALRQAARWRDGHALDAFDALLWDRAQGREVLYPGVASFFPDAALRRAVLPPYRGWDVTSHLEDFYRECRRIKPDAHDFEMMIAHECQRRIPDLLLAGFEPIARALDVHTAYPFLDPGLIELVSGLQATRRFRHHAGIWWNKLALRELAAARLPMTICSRLATSYTAPFSDWMREPVFARPTLARLRRSRFWQAGLVRPDLLARILRAMARTPAQQRGKLAWADQLWVLITLSAWYDRYVERSA